MRYRVAHCSAAARPGLTQVLALMSEIVALREALALIFEGISKLASTFKGRRFTIDGRLVGDIGESLAGLDYQLTLDERSRAVHDAVTPNGRNVQIKATFQNHLTFKTTPEMYLGFKLNPDGTYQEIFNGPGQLIFDRFNHRAHIGEKLLRFPIAELITLSAGIPDSQRVLRKDG